MANRKTLSKTKTANSVIKQVGVSAALLLASTNVSALGLGTFDVQSNLDQPLNGTIELRTSAGDDVRSVTAVIASREDFERLGIDYPTYLENLSLTLEDFGGASSGKVLRVRSNGVIINEPFIHFLVRVEWSGGSFLREYTALIDPPVYAAETPNSIAQPRSVGTDQSYQGSTDAIEVEALDNVEADTGLEEATTGDDAPLIEDNFYDNSDDTGSVVSGGDNDGARYGPVESGESLSLIAQELQRQFPDLSIYAIMQVMFEENQSSFINNNINGLIKGSVLEIGDLNTIRAVDSEAAKEFFTNQLQQWDPSSLASSSDDSSINVGQDDYSSSDESDDVYSSSDDSGDSFQVGGSDAADDFVSGSQNTNREGEVLVMQQQINDLEASLASSEAEKFELKERISSLEGQLSDLNRLVEIENTELGQIQGALGDDEADSLASDGAGAIDEFLSEGVDEAASEFDETLSELEGVDSSEADDILSEFLEEGSELADEGADAIEEGLESAGNELDDFLGDAEDTIEDGLAPVDDTIDDVSGGIDSAIDDQVEDAPVADTPSAVIEKPQSFVDKAKSMIFEGGLWKALAGVGGLLVAGLIFLFFRRRRADEEFEISMLSIESNSQSVNASQNDVNSASISTSVASVAETVPDKETSFLTVYSDSDAVVQADEVDPVAEADVYIAYGRDEQAEEVLLDGIASHPDRVDIKRKLLSLYHKTENAEGFERVAEELYSQREGLTPEIWEEVSVMGKEVAPSNPLFDLSVDDLSAAAASSTGAVAGAAAAGAAALAGGLASAKDGAEDVAAGLTEAVGEVTDEAKEAAEKLKNTLTDEESIHLVDFKDGHSETSELDAIEIDALSGDDIDLDISESDDDSDVIEFTDTVLDDASIDSDSSVLEIDLEESTDITLSSELSSDDEPSIGEVSEVSDLEIDPDYDEARTQYELAKVFVDLGDEDGARKILDELVANDGNDKTVVEDAQKLLDSING